MTAETIEEALAQVALLELENLTLKDTIEELDSGIREALDIIAGWTVRRPDDVDAIDDILNNLLRRNHEQEETP